MSDWEQHANTVRDAMRYQCGWDVAGWEGHLRPIEVQDRHEAALDALVRQLADARAEAAALRERLDGSEQENHKRCRQLVEARAEADRLREALVDFRDHGTRFDCNPTVMIHADNPAWWRSHQWWCERASQMDCAARNRAAAALAAAQEPPGFTPDFTRGESVGMSAQKPPGEDGEARKPCPKCGGTVDAEGLCWAAFYEIKGHPCGPPTEGGGR